MTTFWISQSKHWCEFCKVWVQPDPVSIKTHEKAQKHQNTVKQFLYEQKQKKFQDKRDKEDLQKTLASIEAAAREQLDQDLRPQANIPPPPPPPPPPGFEAFDHTTGRGIAAGPTDAPGLPVVFATGLADLHSGVAANDLHLQPPPPPPPVPLRKSRWGDSDAPPPPPPPPPPPTEAETDAADVGPVGAAIPGRYTVRGVTYVEGEFCLELLQPGAAVEAFVCTAPPPTTAVAAAEAAPVPTWQTGRIVQSHKISVPNTQVVLHTFSVELDSTSLIVKDVAASNLRMIAVDAVAPEEREEEAPPPATTDEFGLPLWQPAALGSVEPAAGEGSSSSVAAGTKRRREGNPFAPSSSSADAATAEALDADGDAMDAYSVHNPFGGRYRGVQLDGGDEEPLAETTRLVGLSAVGVVGRSTTSVVVTPAAAGVTPAVVTAAPAEAEQAVVVFKARAPKKGVQLRRKASDD